MTKTFTLFAFTVLALTGCGDSTTKTPRDGGNDGATVDDGSTGTTLDDCLSGLQSLVDTQVVRFATGDGKIRLGFASGAPASVCDDVNQCACNGGTCSRYVLTRFGIERDGETVCVSDAEDLEYLSGQHSWTGLATVSTATERFVVDSQLDFGTQTWNDSLTLYDVGSDTPKEGPLPLVSEDCYSVPAGMGNSGCCDRCQRRERSDL